MTDALFAQASSSRNIAGVRGKCAGLLQDWSVVLATQTTLGRLEARRNVLEPHFLNAVIQYRNVQIFVRALSIKPFRWWVRVALSDAL